jgi:hypothetical protein
VAVDAHQLASLGQGAVVAGELLGDLHRDDLAVGEPLGTPDPAVGTVAQALQQQVLLTQALVGLVSVKTVIEGPVCRKIEGNRRFLGNRSPGTGMREVGKL